jgi:glycosyltransferase involved in cell wall biosynthesis
MTSHRKVSIVIPVFNGSDYMREAIDSALEQTYPNVEVIVVNDGSTDGGKTEEAARSYGDRIRYFHKENGGVASALNLGISMMSGDYFSWLSHDDVYYPDKIAVQMIYMSKEGEGVILYSDYEFIDRKSRRLNIRRLPGDPGGDFRLRLMFDGSLHGCTLLIPKECFCVAGTFNEDLKTTQDYDLWFRMAMKYRFVRVPEILVKSRLHPGQTSNTVKSLHTKESNDFLIGCLKVLEEGGGSSNGKLSDDTYYSLAVKWKVRGFYVASGFAYSSWNRSLETHGALAGLRRKIQEWNYAMCDKKYNIVFLIRVIKNIYQVDVVPKIRKLLSCE